MRLNLATWVNSIPCRWHSKSAICWKNCEENANAENVTNNILSFEQEAQMLINLRATFCRLDGTTRIEILSKNNFTRQRRKHASFEFFRDLSFLLSLCSCYRHFLSFVKPFPFIFYYELFLLPCAHFSHIWQSEFVLSLTFHACLCFLCEKRPDLHIQIFWYYIIFIYNSAILQIGFRTGFSFDFCCFKKMRLANGVADSDADASCSVPNSCKWQTEPKCIFSAHK